MNVAQTRSADSPAQTRTAPSVWPAYAAFLWGLLFAGISCYWGCGGRTGLDTVGGAIERRALDGDAAIYAAV